MYNREYQQLSAKHGRGSVMVWGCISASGVGMTWIIKTEKWHQTLIHNEVPSGKCLNDSSFNQQTGLPRARTSTLKQREIILTENVTKCSQHPKKSFGCPSRTLKNYSWRLLKKYKKSFIKAFTLCWRVKMIIPIINLCKCTNSVFVSYTVFPYIDTWFSILTYFRFRKRLKKNNKE